METENNMKIMLALMGVLAHGSPRFDPLTLGLGGESVAQGCKNLPPVAI